MNAGTVSVKPKTIAEVINTHDQLMHWREAGLEKRPVALCVHHSNTGRTSYRDDWVVYSPWQRTSDTDEPWYSHGNKHFNRYNVSVPDGIPSRRLGPEQDKLALQLAIDWANRKYGPFEWVRNRCGDYVPKELNAKFPIRRNGK